MNSLSDSLFKNDSRDSTSNMSKRIWTTWKHDVSQDSLQCTPDKKKLKLHSCPKSPQQLDQKSSRRIGISTRVKKARPVTAENKSGLCNQITISHSGKEKPHGLDRECIKLTDSTLPQNAASPLSTKHTKSSQTDSQKLVGEVSEPDLDALKATLQKAVEEFVECKRMLKETSSNLEHVMGIIKKHVPSVLESAPLIVSQVLEDTNSDIHFHRKDSLMEIDVVSQVLEDTNSDIHFHGKDSLMELDVGRVQTMAILIKEFNSYVLVLETIPESAVIKERLLKEVKTREELFEENLMKFKENKPWLLTDGLQALDNDYQAFIRNKYKNYTEALDLKMKSMKEKRKALTQSLQENNNETQVKEKIVREPLSNKTNDSLYPGLEIVSSPLGNLSSDSSSSSASSTNNSGDNSKGEEDKSVCEEDKTKDISKNKNDKHSTVASKEDWPGKSLPVLDDLVSDESQEGSSSGSLTSADSSEADRGHNSPPPPADITQDESNDDQIVEALLAEAGPELDTDVNGDEDVGNHFLASQFASVYSPTGPGFLYNIPLKPSQKLGKELSNSLMNQEHFCSQCQEHVESKESMYSHKLLHHVAKMCNLCTEIVANGLVLKEHVSKCHESYSLCLECYEAVETSSMADHATKHPGSKKKINHKFKCRACFKIFDSQDEVNEHEKNEKDHKKAFYFCKHCGDLFLTRYELQKHTSLTHLAVQLNICKVCFLDFSDKPSLGKHLKNNHNVTANKSPKKFACICCCQHFKQKTELIEHMRLIHQNDDLVVKASQGEDNGNPNNKCPHCTSFFKNKKVKAVHEIIFHETAPYTCLCNAAFFNKAKLDEHALQHTRLEEETMKSKRRPRMASIPL